MKAIVLNQFTWRKAVLILLAVLLSNSLGFAQTRFYLNATSNTLTPANTPAFNAGWNVTTGGTSPARFIMSNFKDGTILTARQSGAPTAINRKCLIDQWITEPLAAQTITGNLSGQVQFSLNNATGVTTSYGMVYLRLINPDGTIAQEVGNYANNVVANLTATQTNRTLTIPITGLVITAGQMLAVDLGWNYVAGTTHTRLGTLQRGSNQAIDLPVNNTTTVATNNPWIEFPTLQFLPPANDECAGAVSLTSAVSCVNTAGTLHRATANGTNPLGCFAAGTYYDVWYKFVATSSVHNVTLSGLGANITSPQIQIYSGACGSLTSLGCASGTTLTQTGLTTGNTYYVRVANATADPSGIGTAANFNICVTTLTAPTNDLCANATTLTSGTACSSITSNIQYAGSQGPSGACVGSTATTTHEVWFKYVATSTTHTVTVNNLGSNLAAASTYIETLSGACGSLTSLGCQAASSRQTLGGLTIGATYYVRVYVTTPPVNVTTANWNFDICVQQPPANDDCSGAVTLVPAARGTCTSATAGTLDLATANAATPLGCFAAGTYYDVWYKFIATSNTHYINLSGLGANFTAPRIQVYSGSCAGLVSVSCVSGTSLTQTGLTPGNTYYVRIANFNVNPSGLGTVANFNICITTKAPPVNDACGAATLLASGITCSSVTSNIQFATSTAPAGTCGGATLTTTYDIWFRFIATSSIQTITLSNLGANLTAATTYIESFSGVCGSLTSLGCQAASTRQTLTGLTAGNVYYTRVYVTADPINTTTTAWNFDICVQSQPVNDECAGAVTLTPGTACVNTAGTLDLATANAATPLGCFAAGTYYDVWYKFVAVSASETITLSSLGANFTAARIQVYSGTCGALTSLSCASASTLTQAGLTVGNTYYVRIANFNADPSGIGTVANFNICITYPAGPANDHCSGAVTLTPGTCASTTPGTLVGANPTAGLASCGNSNSADVWYKFVATTNFPTINLSTVGANLAAASPLIQLFSGSCGSLTPISTPCAGSPYTPGGLGLSINSTYYVRITTNTNTGIPSGTWAFNICVNANAAIASAIVDYGKSYVNITAGTTGGTIRPGDELEIRATLVVSKATGPAVAAIDSVAYLDTITANKGYYLMRDSMALRTNEGKLFRPSSTTYFTDAKDLDAAWVTRVGSDTTIQMNMGINASVFVKGKIRNTSKPSNFGSTCIIMATYHVRVNAAYDTKIMYGGGAFKYRDTLTGIFYTVSFPRDSLIVYSSAGACPDAISPVNIVGDEVGGTFGAPSGAPVYLQNRGASANTNYTFAAFGANAPQDYYYSVANNTSATAATVQTVVKGTSPTRVFGVWDITGDHTSATDPIKGNLPCNINQPISATNPCGYMLVVNSAYRADKAFTYTFTGACTETYYEISAWMKNICSRCGCDSNGVGSSNAGYIPTGPLDSAGIRPNVAFQIDGVDYYTTGDILHKGIGAGTTQTGSDTLNQWIKKSFVFKTAPGQTNFTMTFRNNAPGGGGNDWVIDDISMRTCFPNMTYSPSSSPSVCTGQTITLSDTVRSYYNVYIYYKWQRSTNGGITWADIAGTNGVASPTLVGPNNYQFINAYTVPPSATGMANNGDLYRMVVATNASNLAGTCNYSDVAPVTLTVLNTCIDIDDDNDGIPDYVEFNNPVALQDANSNGIPNWNDPTYAGYIDNNIDGVNDNFDFGADANNDGIPNYLDITFPGFVDSNGDGVNDNADKDKDGIINQYDLDSDNDGIPDVVESYGVDTNGDGVIDNYSDTDSDGFSNNVDGSNGGVAGSSVGLGAQDFDGDGVPNYLDTDSDSDGIPDVVEAGGLYTSNSGRLSNFIDLDQNGLSDNNTGLTGLLKSGADISPVDGRADDYPNKNLDRDFRPSAYDLDSDGDGIADVIEAGLPDTDLNGKADGVNGTNGWSTTVSALPALTLRNTDGVGNPDFLDIDSDEDGIPDNIEGMSTASYIRPTSTTDTDGDGLINHYDNFNGFGGSGIFVYDHDSDGTPDYRDLDTDSDGQPDIIEGNDFNLNKMPDDLVTLTGLDTDGDGLDNRFDSLNSVTNLKGTSYMMGSGGSFIGDAAPGTRATVQRSFIFQTDRDWRYISTVLPVQFLNFAGLPQDNTVLLNWSIITPKDIDRFEVERSTDNSTYQKTGTVTDPVKLNEQQDLSFTDNITGISNDIIYYRLKVIAKTGETKYSNVLVVRRVQNKTQVNIMPNPASNYVNINLYSDKNSQGTVTLIDKLGRKVLTQEVKIVKGINNIYLPIEKYGQGVYSIVIETSTEKINKQLIIVR